MMLFRQLEKTHKNSDVFWENPRINDFIMVHAADVGDDVLKRDDVCTRAYRGQATVATANGHGQMA